jgi:dipeptidyl aminopeptidase/acylaminoacyl peptidase
MNHPGQWTRYGKRVNSQTSDEEKITYEETFIKSHDGVNLHVWLLSQPLPGAPTLIYFHGNAGNMGFRLKNAAHMYANVGVNVLMMDYRGYGRPSMLPS